MTATDELLARYLQHLRRRQLSDATVSAYSYQLRSYSRAADPFTATAEDIEAWLDSCRLGSWSRRYYISSVTGLHRWMSAHGLRIDDPTVRVAHPKTHRRLPRPIPTGDLARAMAPADARMRLWLCLAAYGGLRCCEIAGLRAEDLTLDSDPPVITLRVTKGKKPRVVPISDAVSSALKAYGPPPRGWLFWTEDGTPMEPREVSKEINTYLAAQGIEATAHQLRHFFGTELYRSTRDLRLVGDLMGHADISTTAGYVALVPDEAAVAAVRALGRVNT